MPTQFLQYWLPAMAGMACLGLGAGLISVYGFFVRPVADEFDVGVAVVNIGPVALLLIPGFISPFVGRLADRLPARGMALIGATVAMGALFTISRVDSLALAAALFFLFSFGLTFYGPVVVNGLMVRQYPGKEARALAIAAIGISIASAVLPPLMGALLSVMDWRTALAYLAAGVWLVLCAITFIGMPSGVSGAAAERGSVDAGVYRRKEFWLVGFCVAIAMSVTIVLTVVYPPHFVAEGYSLTQAGWFLSLAGMSGLTGKAMIAWLGDAGRAHAKWLAIGVIAAQAVGLALLLQAESAAAVMMAMCFLGFGGGAFMPMHPYLNSRYFDTAVISQVIGAQMPLFLPFGLVGAPLAGLVYDKTGSHDLVFVGLIGVLVIAMLLALRLPRSER